MLRNLAALGVVVLSLFGASPAAARRAPPHNVIIFVADGLRSGIVSNETAPTLSAVRREGVDFRNSHSLFPTITTPNASAIATGHLLGDTGNFANSLYTGGWRSTVSSVVPPLENDRVLGELNDHFGGNYLNETSVLMAAHAKGYSTAAIGKLGPVAIQAVTARAGEGPIVIDDGTGHPEGLPLADDMAAALAAAGLATAAPSRGENNRAGDARAPGTLTANVEQQRWFLDVATRVLLPKFKAAGKPFVLVYWSRDPDGTQHNQGDSLGRLAPGINGPTSMAAIRNADSNLAELRGSLRALGLDRTTDILVTADHGFSTVSKESRSSFAASLSYRDVPPGKLPPGFLAIDLAEALGLVLYDTAAQLKPLDASKGQHPLFGAGAMGKDPEHLDVVVAANGGADLVYLPGPERQALARRVVEVLLAEDYTGAVFVNDALGPIPGSLPMSRIGLIGTARTPQPSIVVGFRSESAGCESPEICAVEVADTNLQQGQGIHGSFSRADTHNFMAAIGPDFKAGFVDPAPASNADVARTAAYLLGLNLPAKGRLRGRILSEAIVAGRPAPLVRQRTVSAHAAAGGLATELRIQTAGGETYFDVAGIPGRAVGLGAEPAPATSGIQASREWKSSSAKASTALSE